MLAAFGLLTIVYIVVMSMAPEEPDWGDSFSRKDKLPYGSFILYELLGDIFPTSEISEVRHRIYDQLDIDYSRNEQLPDATNYIFINTDFSLPTEYDIDELLYFAEIGNHVFIAARYFSEYLQDTLGFDTNQLLLNPDSAEAKFYNPHLSTAKGYQFDKQNLHDFFSEFDSTSTLVLACNNQAKPNLIQIPFGEGAFLLCTTPNVMTNYYMLQEQNRTFISTTLSHLPSQNKIWWDEYYKVRYQEKLALARSPLQYIYSQEALLWGFRIVLWVGILYVLFEIKRRQRIIPIVKALPNSTLIFTETIGRLYFQSSDHKNIAEKKIKILLAHIRRRYFLKTHLFTDEFMKKLAAKSGLEEEDIISLCHTVDSVRREKILSENELIHLNNKIEAFYEQSRAEK